MPVPSLRTLLSILMLAAVAGCGGSSSTDVSPIETPPGNETPGGEQPGGEQPGNETPPGEDGPAMTMHCVDGSDFQCSGDTVLRVENGVALTDSGVQAYGVSTSDLAPVNTNPTGASGYQPAQGGSAEVRLEKAANGTVENIYLLLRNLGLSWDGSNERPPIIETFNPTQGRVEQGTDGRLSFLPLPDSSDLTFYDFVTLGPDATQAHYANNRYFPRSGNPSRCAPDLVPCPEVETNGVSNDAGDWRTGGSRPDWSSAQRLHGDGDVHAGNGQPDANGDPTWLAGGNGIGVPFPGSKGYRTLGNWAYRYANLATWETQDTVLIEEWAHLGNEHNKIRRGVVAFGDVTAPSAVPTAGSATYAGIAYGWYTPDGTTEPVIYWGNATASADFATGEVAIVIQDTVTYDVDGNPVPAALNATAALGNSQDSARNYMTAPAAAGAMNGGLSARFFGPVASGGPAELAGAYTLSNAGSGEAVIGGFMGMRQ